MAANSQWVIEVDEASFDEKVVRQSRERPVVVDFWAPWCGPCRMLGPILEKLAKEKEGAFVLAKLNVDEAPELSASFRIEGIPAVKAFRDGQPILQFEGLLPEPALREFIERICPSETEKLVQQARSLEESEPARAEALYRQAIEADKAQASAIVGLARVLVHKGEVEQAEELLQRVDLLGEVAGEAEKVKSLLELRKQAGAAGTEAEARQRVEAEPANPQRRYELGNVLAAAGKHREALEMLLSAAQADRDLARNKVRPTMLQIFQIIGVRSDLADEYRDKLSKLLY